MHLPTPNSQSILLPLPLPLPLGNHKSVLYVYEPVSILWIGSFQWLFLMSLILFQICNFIFNNLLFLGHIFIFSIFSLNILKIVTLYFSIWFGGVISAVLFLLTFAYGSLFPTLVLELLIVCICLSSNLWKSWGAYIKVYFFEVNLLLLLLDTLGLYKRWISLS